MVSKQQNPNPREVPFSLEAERSVLGAILLREGIMSDLVPVLDPTDFYDPAHQACFTVMCQLWDDGRTIDPVTVSTFGVSAVTSQLVTGFIAETPSVSAYKSYADVIIELSRRRRLIVHLSELTERAFGGDKVDDILDADPLSDRLLAPRQADIKDLYSIGEFMHRVASREFDTRPWLIPHLMKSLWRFVLVAPEGFGKAVLMRFLAVHAAAGRDPWQPHYRIPQRRVLYLDVENAESSVHHQFSIANRSTDFDIIGEAEGFLHMWHREGGMDLRMRRHRAQFEAVLQKTRPEIVFAGPLYKLFKRGRGEDMEQATIEFTEIIDELRVRYGFAIMLEHHAAKGKDGHRELVPFGSSVFLRWPEFGLTMEPIGPVEPDDTNYMMKMGRFRRDRERADWPNELERRDGSKVPWIPMFDRGRGTKLGLARHPEHGEWVPSDSF